ncbi:MAG: hypothetical protein JXR96_07520 [Deltaproteobacteria bacterium]|nr:hypothetical protein [Deltaproteobacteria bacterium]
MTRLNALAVLLASAMLCTGCINVLALELKENMEVLEGERAKDSTPAPVKADRDISVRVAAGESLGCIMIETADEKIAEEMGTYGCSFFELSDPEPVDRIKEKFEAVENALWGVHASGLSESFRDIIQYRLSERFRNATVELGEGGGEAQIRITKIAVYHGWSKLSEKNALVSLTATLPGGAELSAAGRGFLGSGNAHLAYLIPIGVLTFPIGLAIGGAIVDSVFRSDLALIVLMAMDEAARDLASQLVEATAGQAPATPPAEPPPPAAPPPSAEPPPPAEPAPDA